MIDHLRTGGDVLHRYIEGLPAFLRIDQCHIVRNLRMYMADVRQLTEEVSIANNNMVQHIDETENEEEEQGEGEDENVDVIEE